MNFFFCCCISFTCRFLLCRRGFVSIARRCRSAKIGPGSIVNLCDLSNWEKWLCRINQCKFPNNSKRCFGRWCYWNRPFSTNICYRRSALWICKNNALTERDFKVGFPSSAIPVEHTAEPRKNTEREPEASLPLYYPKRERVCCSVLEAQARSKLNCVSKEGKFVFWKGSRCGCGCRRF